MKKVKMERVFFFFNDESNYSLIGVRFCFKKSDFPDMIRVLFLIGQKFYQRKIIVKNYEEKTLFRPIQLLTRLILYTLPLS